MWRAASPWPRARTDASRSGATRSRRHNPARLRFTRMFISVADLPIRRWMNSAASAGRRPGGRPTLKERLSWPTISETEAPISQDRAMMARTYAVLFALGATLALVTLPLPHDAGRDTTVIVLGALISYLTAITFVVGFDRLPLWGFKLSPV